MTVSPNSLPFQDRDPNSKLRQDPVTGRWVVIAESRAGRPTDFQSPQLDPVIPCPFCGGNEQETPQTICQFQIDGSPNPWDVRVIPNKFPAIQNREATESGGSAGLHEIFIESADHVASLTELSQPQLHLVFRAYRDRLKEVSDRADLAYCSLFKNSGPIAGASLEHVHSQLIGMPIVPHLVGQEILRQRAAFEDGGCLMCQVLKTELETEQLIVAQTDRYVAFCPYASRFSHEVWIVPREHLSRFETTADDSLSELADLFVDMLKRVERIYSSESYNILFQLAPFEADHDPFHWRIEICPRYALAAGFELSSGCFINPTPPETAARKLQSR